MREGTGEGRQPRMASSWLRTVVSQYSSVVAVSAGASRIGSVGWLPRSCQVKCARTCKHDDTDRLSVWPADGQRSMTRIADRRGWVGCLALEESDQMHAARSDQLYGWHQSRRPPIVPMGVTIPIATSRLQEFTGPRGNEHSSPPTSLLASTSFPLRL